MDNGTCSNAQVLALSVSAWLNGYQTTQDHRAEVCVRNDTINHKLLEHLIDPPPRPLRASVKIPPPPIRLTGSLVLGPGTYPNAPFLCLLAPTVRAQLS